MMADDPENDDVLDLTEDQITDEGGDDADVLDLEDKQEIANDDDKAGDDAEPEVVVTFGDDDPDPDDDARAPQWVRDLRKANREKDRRIKELEAAAGVNQSVEVGPEPTLEDCDYDTEEFKKRWKSWADRKAQADAEEQAAEDARKTAEERWNAKLTSVEQQAAELGVKDFDDAEDNVREVLSAPMPGLAAEDLRLNIIKQGAKNPALVIYALGKNRKRAEELAKIDDPVEFAFAVGRMEAELKVNRKPAVGPEKTGVSESAGTGGGAVDNQLDKLRAEAAKTGDYSKVLAYKRRKRNAA